MFIYNLHRLQWRYVNTDPINALPGDWHIDFADVHPADSIADPVQAVQEALNHPLASLPLQELSAPDTRVVVVFDPVAPTAVLRTLLDGVLVQLRQTGVADEQITLLLSDALSSAARADLAAYHFPILSPLVAVTHDPDDLRQLDELGMVEGVAVRTNYRAVEADLLIGLGVVQPDWYAGYLGGGDGVAVGLANSALRNELRDTRFLSEREQQIDRISERAYQRLIRESARRAGLRFVLNAVLDSSGRFVALRAGDPNAVHDDLSAIAQRQREVGVAHDDYDAIVADQPAGFASVFEAGQAAINLGNTPSATLMHGGLIVLPTQCAVDAAPTEAAERFYEVMTSSRDSEMVLRQLQNRMLRPGEDQAYLLAQVMQHYRVMIVGEDCEKLAQACHFVAVRDMNEAVDLAETLLGPKPRTLVLPNARQSVPVFSPSLARRVARKTPSKQDFDDNQFRDLFDEDGNAGDSDGTARLSNLPTINWLDDIDVERILDANDAD